MQKQIVILAGGKSERFGGQVPKPFVRIWGKQMGEFLGESLRSHVQSTFWICGPMLQSYDVLGEVTRWWKGGNHSIHFLKYQTRSPVESLFLGLSYFFEQGLLQKDKPILVLDNDNYYDASVCRFFDVGFFDTFSSAVLTRHVRDSDTPKYGFLQVQDSTIVAVKEKQRGWGETHISLGGYAFKTVEFLHTLLASTSAKNLLEALFSKTDRAVSVETHATYSIGTPEDLLEAEQHWPEKFSWKNTRIVVDLDNTLVTYPRKHGDYTTVVFREKVLEWLTYVKSKGATLILSTARRSETHKGNSGKIVADIGQTVLTQLQESGLQWEEIHFGKAYGDIYLDDRGYNPINEFWMSQVGDFHLQTGPLQDSYESILEKSKKNIRKEKLDVIFKQGTATELQGYKYYLETIQSFPSLVHLFPKLYSYKHVSGDSYELMIQYIRGIESSVLFAHGLLREKEWAQIFSHLRKLHSIEVPEQTWTYEELHHQWIGKTNQRLIDYKDHYSYPVLETLIPKIHLKLEAYVQLRKQSLPCSIIHGDAWLSNLLFNENNELFFIDMRGKTSTSRFTITGDAFYDYAKLGTSILGMDTAVFDLPEVLIETRLQHWVTLLGELPAEYKPFFPALVFSLMITAFWNYPPSICLKLVQTLKQFSFLLDS